MEYISCSIWLQKQFFLSLKLSKSSDNLSLAFQVPPKFKVVGENKIRQTLPVAFELVPLTGSRMGFFRVTFNLSQWHADILCLYISYRSLSFCDDVVWRPAFNALWFVRRKGPRVEPFDEGFEIWPVRGFR